MNLSLQYAGTGQPVAPQGDERYVFWFAGPATYAVRDTRTHRTITFATSAGCRFGAVHAGRVLEICGETTDTTALQVTRLTTRRSVVVARFPSGSAEVAALGRYWIALRRPGGDAGAALTFVSIGDGQSRIASSDSDVDASNLRPDESKPGVVGQTPRPPHRPLRIQTGGRRLTLSTCPRGCDLVAVSGHRVSWREGLTLYSRDARRSRVIAVRLPSRRASFTATEDEVWVNRSGSTVRGTRRYVARYV